MSLQSKVGFCTGAVYSLFNVPAEVAASVSDKPFECLNCGARYEFHLRYRLILQRRMITETPPTSVKTPASAPAFRPSFHLPQVGEIWSHEGVLETLYVKIVRADEDEKLARWNPFFFCVSFVAVNSQGKESGLFPYKDVTLNLLEFKTLGFHLYRFSGN
jgi:hypothetical protein